MKNITALTILFFLGSALAGCGEKTTEVKTASNPANAEQQPAAEAIVPEGAKVEKLSQDQFEFVEGPAWDNSGSVYFTDIPNNSIYRYNLETREFTLVTDQTAGANGLMFDREDHLLACEQDTGSVTRWDIHSSPATRLATIAAGYDGTRFNRPNDMVMDSSNGIYFTDPSWSEDRPQKIKGVYYADTEGNVRRLVDDMDKPNGVILSADEKTLYIDDSDSFEVRAYPVVAPGRLGERSIFATLTHPADYDSNISSADGVALDVQGNLYISTRFGVQIFSPQGRFIETIAVPESPSNCVFAGKELDTLFITARKNVYSIKLNTRGLSFPL